METQIKSIDVFDFRRKKLDVIRRKRKLDTCLRRDGAWYFLTSLKKNLKRVFLFERRECQAFTVLDMGRWEDKIERPRTSILSRVREKKYVLLQLIIN